VKSPDGGFAFVDKILRPQKSRLSRRMVCHVFMPLRALTIALHVAIFLVAALESRKPAAGPRRETPPAGPAGRPRTKLTPWHVSCLVLQYLFTFCACQHPAVPLPIMSSYIIVSRVLFDCLSSCFHVENNLCARDPLSCEGSYRATYRGSYGLCELF
jgi:hypothetical protein